MRKSRIEAKVVPKEFDREVEAKLSVVLPLERREIAVKRPQHRAE